MQPRLPYVVKCLGISGFLIYNVFTASSSHGLSFPYHVEMMLAQMREKIPFENVAQGESPTAELAGPTLFIADSPSAATRCTELMGNAYFVSRVRSINFDTSLLICLFRGRVGSHGYSINIQEITIESGSVKLRVKLRDPEPNQNVSAAISYPYHIVKLPRKRLDIKAKMSWTIYTVDGQVLLKKVFL